MPRRRGRPKGSSTDDYIIGFMCGMLRLLGPSDARYLARIALMYGLVPRGGTRASRVDRLARKICTGNFRADTEEWWNGYMLVKQIDARLARPLKVPLLDYYDTSGCVSLKDVMRLAPRRRRPKPPLPPE
jgi:hypothetical protein